MAVKTTPASVIKRLIPLADAHQKSDEYQSGHYWQGNGSGTGCSVGCTVHDAIKLKLLPKETDHGNHEQLAKATGMPEMLWRLADNIFEGLPDDKRPAWTPRLLRAAAKCKRLDRVPARVMARLADRLAADAIRDDVKATATVVAGLWRRRGDGYEPDEKEWDAAREQADAAWKQAYAAWKQAYAVRKQADAVREQAYAAWEQFWKWCADVVCEELAAAK